MKISSYHFGLNCEGRLSRSEKIGKRIREIRVIRGYGKSL